MLALLLATRRAIALSSAPRLASAVLRRSLADEGRMLALLCPPRRACALSSAPRLASAVLRLSLADEKTDDSVVAFVSPCMRTVFGSAPS